jgi:hypothetical protein
MNRQPAMLSILCPRCNRVWYTAVEKGGSIRLCALCKNELRPPAASPDEEPSLPTAPRKRRRKRWAISGPLDMFLLAVLLLTAVDLALFGLSRIWPEPFLAVLLLYGLILSLVGLKWLRALTWRCHIGDVDWGVGRWPLLLVLLGAMCVGAFFPMFYSIREEKQATATTPQGGRR